MGYDPNKDYRAVAARKARKYGLDPDIFVAQIEQESGFAPDVITGARSSPAGAQGIAQIMPATARGWGVNPLKPGAALDAAARNMAAYVKQYGGYENALRAYNAGPGAIQASHGYAETNQYVENILNGRDPGRLGAPATNPSGRGGQGRRGGVTVGPGRPPQAAQTALDVPAVDVASLAALLTRPEAQPQQTTPLAAPEFSAARYVSGGLPVGSSQPVERDSPIGQRLAALAQSMPVSLGDPQRATKGTAPRVVGRQPVGKTLVIGDSLEAGTFPLLKQKLGNKVKGIFVPGKPAPWGIEQLRAKWKPGRFQNVVFDLGTNDWDLGQFKQSLHQLHQIVGPDTQIFLATVNSPRDEEAKNQAIRQFAGRHSNVTVIPWKRASAGGRAPGMTDMVHGAYDKRAAMIARSLGYQPRRPVGAGRTSDRPVRGRLQEMFFNVPGAINVDSGARVPIGTVDGHTGHVHVAGDGQSMVNLGRLAQSMGLAVRENPAFDPVDPVHTDGSFHYRRDRKGRGRAIDVSGDQAKLLEFNRLVARTYGV